MHVVLTEDLSNLGKSGELVRVRPGFARNYLIPRGLAVSATEENKARIEHEKKVAESRATKAKAAASELAQKLGSVKISIARPVGENDKLYGSVTARDIEEALAQQGYVVDRRRIDTEPLKALGTYQVPVHLATSVTATVEVTVTAK
ncbi:MAG: 50S ribosomal protein L9 [Polyangiaceae bacterium]|nr:50S ribosomal protein L9 [Polyangiaceae bacterium]